MYMYVFSVLFIFILVYLFISNYSLTLDTDFDINWRIGILIFMRPTGIIVLFKLDSTISWFSILPIIFHIHSLQHI
jgi:hypothetical protein